MTKPLRAAIEIIAGAIKPPKRVLEVGSRQAVNQEDIADLRVLFPKSKYVGLDMEKGPGVDVVQNGEKIPFADSSFDLVLCLETFEHAEKFWVVAKEIERVVAKGGMAIVSSQQNFPIHLHPSDYFRFTPFGMKSLFPNLKSKFCFAISPPFDDEVKLNPQHVIMVGTKSTNQSLMNKLKKQLKRQVNKISVHKPYRHRVQDGIRILKRAFKEAVFRQEIEFF